MPKETQDLRAFLLDEMRDVYDAEKQLTKALPRMAKASGNEELRNAITEHLEVTKGQVQRLEQCFEHLEEKPRSKPCKGMRGIIEEGSEMLQENLEDTVMDIAIAAGGRKIEHYEMVAYESLQAIAEQLGLREVAELLGETLEEERQADQQLNEICQQVLGEADAGEETEEEEREMRAPSRGRGSSAKTAAKGGAKAQTKQASSRSASKRAGSAEGHAAHPLTDHEEIRRWAEERDATPSCVRGTGKKGGIGMIRLDFPGFSGEDSLQPIEWDEWFDQFDRNNLELIVQETTAGGERSNFNKLVSRGTSKQKQQPRTRGAH